MVFGLFVFVLERCILKSGPNIWAVLHRPKSLEESAGLGLGDPRPVIVDGCSKHLIQHKRLSSFLDVLKSGRSI